MAVIAFSDCQSPILATGRGNRTGNGVSVPSSRCGLQLGNRVLRRLAAANLVFQRQIVLYTRVLTVSNLAFNIGQSHVAIPAGAAGDAERIFRVPNA